MGQLLTFDWLKSPKLREGRGRGGETHTHTQGCQRERKLTLISSVWFRYKSTTSCPFVNPAGPHAGLRFRVGVITPPLPLPPPPPPALPLFLSLLSGFFLHLYSSSYLHCCRGRKGPSSVEQDDTPSLFSLIEPQPVIRKLLLISMMIKL